jgi:N-acetylglucosaminyldiphosphoundecaprenol N-acetyl-beta-D-mannosaminyltransferase
MSAVAVDAAGIPRVNVLGVGVSALNLSLAVSEIARWIEEGRREYVCVTGMHGVVESLHAESLRRIHNGAGLVTPDGMPMAWLLWRHGHRRADRVCGAEFMGAVVEHGIAHSWRHYLYGTKPETLALLEAQLKARFPKIEIVGRLSPPFRELTPEEDEQIVADINASGANIVWVGLSTPKQERWMAAHRAKLNASALMGVGAAFDFHAGTVRQAPRFIQRSGFEWLYRLSCEPRRLWRRYATGIPTFLWEVLLQETGLRRYPADWESGHV